MDLISREEIEELTNIGQSQFKSFRRLGLVEGHVKKTSIVKLDERKTTEKGKEIFTPSGFTYLYPRTVLSQIKWIQEQRKRGKNLMEIQGDFIKKKIQEQEDFKRRAHTYEKIFTIPAGAPGENGVYKKFVGNAVMELTEQIKQDHPDREVKILVFFVEHEKYPSAGKYVINTKVKLDTENSKF